MLIDELDRLARTDGGRDYPLLGAMRSLQAQGVCSFVLAGFDYLHRETLDQRSPLYNFATVKELGPLEPEAAADLARVPMERLGVRHADTGLSADIAALTGGHPSLVQQLCAELLNTLGSERKLVITAEHVARARDSSAVRGYLRDLVAWNTSPASRLAAFAMRERERFTSEDVDRALRDVTGRNIPMRVIEEALRQLRFSGFVTESRDEYTWAIPLLRDILAGDSYAMDRLVEELPDDPARWLDIGDRDRPSSTERA